MLISICCNPGNGVSVLRFIQISRQTLTHVIAFAGNWSQCGWFGWCIASIDAHDEQCRSSRTQVMLVTSAAWFPHFRWCSRIPDPLGAGVLAIIAERIHGWKLLSMLTTTQTNGIRHKCRQSESKLLPWFRRSTCVWFFVDANDSLDKLSAISSKSFVDCCVWMFCVRKVFVNKATLDWLGCGGRNQPKIITHHILFAKKFADGAKEKRSPYTHKIHVCVVRKCGIVATEKSERRQLCIWSVVYENRLCVKLKCDLQKWQESEQSRRHTHRFGRHKVQARAIVVSFQTSASVCVAVVIWNPLCEMFAVTRARCEMSGRRESRCRLRQMTLALRALCLLSFHFLSLLLWLLFLCRLVCLGPTVSSTFGFRKHTKNQMNTKKSANTKEGTTKHHILVWATASCIVCYTYKQYFDIIRLIH